MIIRNGKWFHILGTVWLSLTKSNTEMSEITLSLKELTCAEAGT